VGTLNCRVAVLATDVRIQSVNGWRETTIAGSGAGPDGGSNGTGAVRGVFLNSRSTLTGFTVTNGHTLTSGDSTLEQSGGGVFCAWDAEVRDCRIVGNSANWAGGGVAYGKLVNCTVTGNRAAAGGGGVYAAQEVRGGQVGWNSAPWGAGAYDCTILLCGVTSNRASEEGGGVYAGRVIGGTVNGNWAKWGGGTEYARVENCNVIGNAASNSGGGACGGTLEACLVSNNTARWGGGAYLSTSVNCRVLANLATNTGGGIYGGLARGCLVTGNGATWGGGTAYSSNENCTVSGNRASDRGGGSYQATMLNTIVWGNTAPTNVNFAGGAAAYSCLTPLSVALEGNMDADPLFLRPEEGNYRLQTNSPCVNTGTNLPWVHGAQDLDGKPRVLGGRADIGAYETPRPVNHYVSLSGGHQTPFLSWGTAATSIQAAVSAAEFGDRVLVTNGFYSTGGMAVGGALTNRVAITTAITLESINGPSSTFIAGAGPRGSNAIRCVYLAAGAVVSGFTLTNGYTLSSGPVLGSDTDGGGAYADIGSREGLLTNCTVMGCGADWGGGAASVVLADCLVTNCTANAGGGAYHSRLERCRLVTCSALLGGATYASDL
jgi:hypothetical protein